MFDPLAIPKSFLRQAKRPELPLSERLCALGDMAHSIDESLRAYATTSAHNRIAAKPEAHAVAVLLEDATMLVRDQFIPLLLLERIRMPAIEQLGEQQRAWLHTFFLKRIYPLLTPLAVDPGHPFPYISSDSLNLLILLHLPGRPGVRTRYARLKVPRQVVARLIDVPSLAEVDSPVLFDDVDFHYWVWSEDVVRFFVHELFAGMSVTGIYQFRVLRTALPRANHESSPIESMREKAAPVVRLDVERDMPTAVVQWLATRLEAPSEAIFRFQQPYAMADWGYLGRRVAQIRQPA